MSTSHAFIAGKWKIIVEKIKLIADFHVVISLVYLGIHF